MTDTVEMARARRSCLSLTDVEAREQRRIYIATKDHRRGEEPVGDLLFCRLHGQPLIKCHDEAKP